MTKKTEEAAPVDNKEAEAGVSLDEIHAQTIAELQDEYESLPDDTSDDTSDDKEDKPEDAPDDKDDAPEEKPLDPAPVPPVPAPPVEPAKEEQEPEADTDVTAPGKGKIAVKDYNGKQFYFNNLDEVPDDFEPESYKAWGRAVQQFGDKAVADRQAAEAEETKRSEALQADRITKVKEGWQKDIQQLDTDKLLPTDQKDRQTTIDAVFALMNEELAKGRILDFAPAFEIYQFRSSKGESKDRAEKQSQEKKDRGSRVQGAGSGSNSNGGNRSSAAGRTFEAPPSGLTLDDIHSSVLGSL